MAMNNLGALYYNGDDIASNYEKAINYFVAACDGGLEDACNNYKNIKDE